MIELAHKETQGANLLLRYTLGIDVKVGRLTRDFSKSPQAEVVIDVDGRLCPERPGRVYRGRLGLLSRSGIKACVDTCKRKAPLYVDGFEGKGKDRRPIQNRDTLGRSHRRSVRQSAEQYADTVCT